MGRLSDVFSRRYVLISTAFPVLHDYLSTLSSTDWFQTEHDALSTRLCYSLNTVRGLRACDRKDMDYHHAERLEMVLLSRSHGHICHNRPFGALLLATPVSSSASNGQDEMAAIRTIDYIGIALFTAGMVLFLIGLNRGGVVYP